MDTSYPVLQIDPNLRRLVLPLSPFQRDAMIEDLCTNGAIRGIYAWNTTILVDYEYYEYCHTLQIPYHIIPLPISCFEEAVVWICRNQLSRKDITEEMQKYLIGKRCITETSLGTRQITLTNQEMTNNIQEPKPVIKYENTMSNARIKIGKELGMAAGTVRKYEQYTQILDRLHQFFPLETQKLLDGRIKLSMNKLEHLATLSDNALIIQFPLELSNSEKKIPRKNRRQTKLAASLNTEAETYSIKNMPAFDPDAEISSLALTIPSWSSSIRRVTNTVDVSTTSSEAREKLHAALNELKLTSDEMLYLLRKNANE